MTNYLYVGGDISSKSFDVCSSYGKKCSDPRKLSHLSRGVVTPENEAA